MRPLDDDAWDAWSPHDLFQRLLGEIHPWYITGGWALDVWHGKQTREHEDLEFAVIRNDADHFRAILHELDFFTVNNGVVEYLPPSADVPSDVWQLWGGDMLQRCWRVDMMMEPGTRDVWIYKRDQTIQMPRSEAICVGETGIPYLAPINVLLFKARNCRHKDHKDFLNAVPSLSTQERQRLRVWLAQLHPGHQWIGNL